MTWTKEDNLKARRDWYKRNKKHEYERIKARVKELVVWYREYKSSRGCSRCTETHWACLEHHHINPKKKDKIVSKMVAEGYGKERILEEMAKCELICSNCHRKLHATDDSSFGSRLL